jgi:hypothetical protein
VNPSGLNTGNKNTQSSFPSNPLVDGIAAAENQVFGVTQNVTNALQQSSNAINKSTNAFNSGVQQASARIDRLGQGVAQASEVLTAAVQDPLPLRQHPGSCRFRIERLGSIKCSHTECSHTECSHTEFWKPQRHGCRPQCAVAKTNSSLIF